MQLLRYTRRMPILGLLPVLATCESPSGPLEFPPVQEVGDVVLPASLEAAYREDAATLAARYVRDAGGEAAKQVQLPTA
ncbi:MAG: hypothetical protein ACRELV_01135, partial [Longimicrobiales bacterium]